MDELLEELLALTAETARQLDQLTAEQLLAFVEQRDAIIERMRQQASSLSERRSHREMVEEILRLDAIIAMKMKSYQDEASRELQKLNLAKRQRSRYESDHAVYADGLFFDRKK